MLQRESIQDLWPGLKDRVEVQVDLYHPGGLWGSAVLVGISASESRARWGKGWQGLQGWDLLQRWLTSDFDLTSSPGF